MPLWNMIFDGLSSDSDSDSPNNSDNNNVPTLRSLNRPGPDGQMPPTDRRSNLEDSRTPPSARHARDIRRTLEDQTTPDIRPSQSSSATDSSDAPIPAGASGTDDSPERGIWRSRTGGYLLYDDYSRPVRETRSRPGAYMQDIVANTGEDEVPTSFILCIAGIVTVVPLGMFLFKLATSIKDIFSR